MPDLAYLFTIRQIADYFQIPPQPLYVWASRGRVPRYGKRGDYRYDVNDFHPLIQRLTDLDRS